MTGPAPRGIAAAISMSIALASPITAARTQIPGVQASGGPIANCENAPARIAKMTREMAVQERALRLASEELTAAQKAMNAASGATNKTVSDALDRGVKKVSKPLQNEIDDYVDARKAVLKNLALKKAGLSVTQRQDLNELVKLAEDQNNALKEGMSAGETLAKLTQSTKDWQTLSEFLDKSGLADQLADAVVKGGSLTPPGAIAIQGFMIARDLIYSGMQEVFTAEEFAQARDNYSNLQGAVSRNREMLDNLIAFCAPPTAPQPQQSPMPTPPAGMQPAAPTPAAPAAPAPAAKPKAGLGKRLGITLGVAGTIATVGGYVATHSESLTGTGSKSGSFGGTPTLKSFTQFICQGNECRGDVTINFPMVITSGSIIVGTDPSFFAGQKTVSSTSAPGDVTITLTHNYSLTCYGTQTGMGIWNSTTTNGPTSWSIKATIPVTCK